MRKIKLLLGASILLLVSLQAGAGIISGAMEGAELWEYSVEGSAFSSSDGSSLDISGSMLIDATVRDWFSPYSSRLEPCNDCQNFFHILSFDLRIGNLSFFGGGPFSNPGNTNALYFDTLEYAPGTFERGNGDWFLNGTGDYSFWVGQYHRFINRDGTDASVSDFFQVAPEIIEMKSSLVGVYMNMTRVARVPAPPAIWLFSIGLIGLIGFTRRRKAA